MTKTQMVRVRRNRGSGFWCMGVAALMSIAAPMPATAQQGAVLRAEQGSAWWLDTLGTECSALRMFGPAGGAVYVTFSRAGRDQPVSLMLSGPSVPLVGVGQNVTVSLMPRGDREMAVTGQVADPSGGNRVILLTRMTMGFLERAEYAQTMQISLPSGALTLSMEDMRGVIAHLRNCSGSAHSSRGGDATPSQRSDHDRTRSGTRSGGRGQEAWPRAVRPRGNESSWIRADDVTDFNITGTLIVDLAVSAAGRVSQCTVAQSSGNAAFDERVCGLLRSRARFDPELDARGNSIPANYRKRIRFAAE